MHNMIVNQLIRYISVLYPICKENLKLEAQVLPHPSWNQAVEFAEFVAQHHQGILAIEVCESESILKSKFKGKVSPCPRHW